MSPETGNKFFQKGYIIPLLAIGLLLLAIIIIGGIFIYSIVTTPADSETLKDDIQIPVRVELATPKANSNQTY